MVGEKVDGQILSGTRSEKPKILSGTRDEKQKNLFGTKWQFRKILLGSQRVKNISRLQCLQSTLARVVTCQRECISISKTVQELHWLPIKWHIDYKVATFLESGEPTYLRSRITSKIFRRAQRSSADDRQLKRCSSHTKIGSRAFRSVAPIYCASDSASHWHCTLCLLRNINGRNSINNNNNTNNNNNKMELPAVWH